MLKRFNKALSIVLTITLMVTTVANAAESEGDSVSEIDLTQNLASSGDNPGEAPTASEFNAMPQLGQVTSGGSFEYSIPIDIPLGTDGMQPELTLSYDSMIRDGLLGHGWTLSGFDTITRDPSYPINFDGNDHYLYNGQRLIRTSDGTFRTQRDLYWIFERKNPNSSTSYWKVSMPDGTKIYYGYSSTYHNGTADDGHIDAAGKDGKALLWSKSLVENARGNGYVIKYVENGAPDYDYYPSEIVYTVGNDLSAYKTITFQTESRDDMYSKYQPTEIKMSRRITGITVKVNDLQVRSYHLTYSYGGQRAISLLSSVQQFGSDDQTALPPYTFTYDTGTVSATEVTPGKAKYGDPYQHALGTEMNQISYNSYHAQFTYGDHIISGDFNGDGRMDFIRQYWGYEVWKNVPFPDFQIYFATDQTAVDGTYRIVSPSGDAYQKSLQAYEGANIITGDFNGDGKTDFIRQEKGKWAANDDRATFQVYFATDQTTEDGTFDIVTPSGSAYQHALKYDDGAYIIPGDFNGDGKTDFIRQEHGSWGKDDSNSFHVFFATNQTAKDGTFHIVKPSGDAYQKYLSGNGANIILGDFNCDGKMDFIRQEYGGWDNDDKGTFQMYFATNQTEVDGTFHLVTPTGSAYQHDLRSDDGATIIPGDFNGDGKMDFIRQEHGGWSKNNNGNGTFKIYFATNLTGFDGTFHIVQPAGDEYQLDLKGEVAQITPGDFNGDGLTDFIRQAKGTADNDNAADFYIYTSNGDGTFAVKSFFPDKDYMGFDGLDDKSGSYLFITDVNGDGKADILRQEKGVEATPGLQGTSGYAHNFGLITTTYTSPKLKKVTNQMGGSASIAYTPVTDVNGAIVPGKIGDSVANSMGHEVVAKVDYDDGYGEQYSYRYQYDNGRIIPGLPKDAVNLGFESVTVIGPNGNMSITHYIQTQLVQMVDPSNYSIKFISNDKKHGLVSGIDNYVVNKDTGEWIKVKTVRNFWGIMSSEGIDQIYLTKKKTTTISANGGQESNDEAYRYDQYGNVTQVTESDGTSVAIAYLYNTADYMVSFPHTMTQSGYTPDGSWQVLDKSKFLYDGQADGVPPVHGNITERQKWNGSSYLTTQTDTYDAYGNALTSTDANGHTTTAAYDHVFYALRVSFANDSNQTERTIYDDLGRPVMKTDPNGQQTKITYDALSRVLTQTIPPSDNLYETVTYLSNANGTIIDYGDDDRTRQVEYKDGFGRVIQTKTQTGTNHYQTIDTYYSVDAATHTLSMKTSVPYTTNTSDLTTRDTSRGMTVEEAYADNRGGIMKLTQPDGKTATVIQDGSQVKTMNYGSDYINKIVYYDGYGNVVKVENYDRASAVANGTPYSWKQYAYYSGTNQLGTITDQDGNVTEAQYDLLGRQTSFRDPDRGSWTYTYDNAGNLIRATDAKGQTVQMSYDAAGRVKHIEDPGGTGTVTYTYDETASGSYNIGHLTTVTYGSGKDQFQYDASGRLTQFQRTIDGKTRSLHYTYDVTGATQSITYPDGEVVTQDDHYGNLYSITGTDMYINSTQYTDYGAVSQLNYGNGTSVNLNYNDTPSEGYSYQLNSLSVSGGNVDLDYHYGFDSKNHLTSIDDRSSDNQDKTLIYDPMDRLIQASYPDGTKDLYSYNAMDNMTQKNGETLSYQGTQSHALTNDGEYVYTYDVNGNMTSRIPINQTIAMNVYGAQTIFSAVYDAQTHSSVSSAVYGALGEYFNNTTLTGAPDLKRTDAAIQFDWSSGSPNSSIQTDSFSVRWTGEVMPQYSEQYTFHTTTDDGVRLWVNGQLFIDDWNDQGIENHSATITLTAGQPYAIQMEYVEHEGDASAKLEWESASQDKEIVPLYHAQGSGGIGIRTFSYDYGNQLTQVNENGVVIFSAAYDYTGQRVKKTEGSKTTYYFFPQYEEVYDGSTLEETDKYYYDGRYTPFAWRQNGTLYYLYTDHLGSVVRVADRSGHVVGKSGYGPYGKTILEEGTLPELRYTGQIYDSSTGLYYYNARYYDPNLAAFITADSVIPGGDTNGYAYAARSPGMYNDPSGHFIGIIMAVSAILIASGVGMYVAGTVTDNKGLQIAGLITAGAGLAIMGLALPVALPQIGLAADSLFSSVAANMAVTAGAGMVSNGISGATGDDSALEWKRVLIDIGFDCLEGLVTGIIFSGPVLDSFLPIGMRDSWIGRNLIFNTKYKETDMWIVRAADSDVLIPGFLAIEYPVKETAKVGIKGAGGLRVLPDLVFGAAVKSPISGAKYEAGRAAGVRDGHQGFAYGAKLAVQPVNVFLRAGGAKMAGLGGFYASASVNGMTSKLNGAMNTGLNKLVDTTTKSWALPKRENWQIYNF
ncbi:PA14 domain-containing protein [Paenibacillus sp. HB172176]|uniref:PA14 domain-containing protein n=1 Tax=Paenibacillus sp. HB172176 TaxID=2493690 RepID=UPI00143BA19C|nr:PA14 domain-containing protein [Paenibacillus sp. HB172176]